MHHIHQQVPPKYKIYLVGLPSVLYETPGYNERSVLNQMFCCFSVKSSVSEKHGAFQCNLGHMVLKGVKWLHNDKIGSNGLERSQ